MNMQSTKLKKRKEWQDLNLSEKIGGVVGLVVIVLLIIIISSTSNKKEVAPVKNKTNATTQSTAPQPQPSPLGYEVLNDQKTNQLRRVTVYTSETEDARIIALNDELLPKYNKDVTNLYIDYFNDKIAADGYFTKQADESLSEAAKDELYTHYVASMKYNVSSGLKELVRQGSEQKTLKSY